MRPSPTSRFGTSQRRAQATSCGPARQQPQDGRPRRRDQSVVLWGHHRVAGGAIGNLPWSPEMKPGQVTVYWHVCGTRPRQQVGDLPDQIGIGLRHATPAPSCQLLTPGNYPKQRRRAGRRHDVPGPLGADGRCRLTICADLRKPVPFLNIRHRRRALPRHQIGVGRGVRFPSGTGRVRIPPDLTPDELSDRSGSI
jgi:hypothetical protein